MRNFYKFIPALLGLVFFMSSTQAFSKPDEIKNNSTNGIKTTNALSENNLKSTLDFTSLPVSENWDADPAPEGWTYFTNSSIGTVDVQSTTYNSPSNAVDIFNSTDETSDYMLVSPGTTLDTEGTRLKFQAQATTSFSSQQTIKIGIMTDPSDPATYTNLSTQQLTADWTEYTVDMSSVTQTGTYYIAFAADFDGTSKHIYIDDFRWEVSPTGPAFQSNPIDYDFGTVLLTQSSDEFEFSFVNYGIGTLSVSDIILGGTDAADFSIIEISETLPFDLTANSANSITVTVQFTPASAGTKSASIDVTANSESSSVNITGDCLDATIYTLPWSENFDAVTVPEFPLGWSNIFNSSNTYADFETSTGGNSPENCIKTYNSSDLSPDMYLITPPTSIDISTTRIRFQAKGTGSIVFGTITDVTDDATFTEISSFTVTSEWQEYILDLDTETSTGDYSLVFKFEFIATYDYIYLDDVMWMEIPTTPVAELSPATYDFGEIAENATLNSGMTFTLRNAGVGNLTVSSISGLDGTEFSVTDILLDTVSIPALESRTFGVAYHPIDSGADAETLSIETNGGTVTTDLSGSAYVLPEGIIEIGWGEIENTGLPMDPYFGYSYSQSIYLQAEINTAGSKITKVYYHKNDSEIWEDAGEIKLYIGHTNLTKFASTSDWIPVSELTEVHYEAALPAGDANGWVEFVLTTPFIYNNVDNLVVAFDENKANYDLGSNEFYNHSVSDTMSIGYRADATNPDPNSPPDGTLKQNRPNIRFQFEEMPATPTPIINPEFWEAGMRPVGYSTTSETFTITNEGTTALTVSNITDLSTTAFSTTFVAGDVNLELGMSYEFSFTFTPTAEGTYQDTFVVETNGINDTVILSGTCDYSLSSDIVEIGWDTATTVTPNLPMEPSTAFTYSQSLYKQSEINKDGQAIYKIFYHQTSATIQNEAIKIYMAHSSNDNLDSGWQILGNLIEVYDGTFGDPDTEGWVEITLDMPFIYNNSDNLIIAFDDNGDNAYLPTDGFYTSESIENLSRAKFDGVNDVDPADISDGDLLALRPNIRMVFGALPTTPIFNLNLTSWDAGMTPGNQTAYSGDIFRITNVGGGELTITDAVLLNGTEFSTSLVAAEINLDGAEEYYFNFSYAPTEIGTHADTLVITHDGDNDTIFLSGHADYVIPENMVEIGQGTETNISLPMDPGYGYSYSQSLYLQNEINMEGMRISKVLYQINNDGGWDDTGDIHIYIGQTTQTTIEDWVDISTLQEVTIADVLPTADEDGWIEFVLTTPFIYNNTDNLIIAFDENTPSYSTYTDEFYNHSVSNNMSIEYHNYSTNPDPTTPPDGTLKMYRPNIRLQFEELPTTTVFAITPDIAEYGTVIVSNTISEEFTVRNNGIGTLTTTSIYLDGTNMDQFALSNLPTFPIDQTNDFADAYNFNVDFIPTTDGVMEAKVYIEHSEGLDSVLISGTGYDATIYAIPYSEYFDDTITTTVPNITLGWNALSNSTNEYYDIESYAGNFQSSPNTIKFYNSGDSESNFMLASPPTSLDPNNTRLRFYADGYSGDQLNVGYFTDQTDISTFVLVETIDLTTDMAEYIVDMSSAIPTGTYYLGFSAVFSSTYHNIYLDNVIWEEIPATPVAELLPATYDFGEIAQNATLNSGMSFTLRNSGVGTLTVSSISGLDGTEFSVTNILLDTVSIPTLESRTFGISYHPIDVGTDTETLSIETNGGTVTTDLSGSAYVLPEGMIEIGWEEELNTNLPMESFYGYSYSQSLYLQNEINMEDMRINKVLYHINNAGEWDNAGDIHIYIGHTTQTTIDNWVDISTLQEVTVADVLPTPDEDGWVEFVLTIPFIYNNTDNLIVAFDENSTGYNSSSDEFYNHSVSNNMSIEYHADGTNPDPTDPPDGTLKMYRPNIRLQFEEIPTTPVFAANPESVDFGDVAMMENVGPVSIVVRNTGIGELIIDNVELTGTDATEFSINVIDDLADTITNIASDYLTVEVSFLPTTEGAKTADITFTDNTLATYTVALNGNSIDVTMYPDTLVTFDDGVIPPPYWTKAEGILEESTTFTSTDGSWISDDYADNTSNTKSARTDIYGTSWDEWLITSPIYLGDGTNPTKLEFDIALVDYYDNTATDLEGYDDKFAVVISTDNGVTWTSTNTLRLWDNQGSEYVYNDLNSTGEHFEISLSDYTGYVKIGLYGESTVSNADNNLFVDNFTIIEMTPEEIAFVEAIDSTTITPTPEYINYVEGENMERVLNYAVNFPTPFNANLDASLLHDYMLELNTPLPTGVTVDLELNNVNMGQIVSDGTQTEFWGSVVTSTTKPVLNSMVDIDVTLKVNGLVTIGNYNFTLKAITALDGEFDDASTRTVLGEGTATINVNYTPMTLPVEESFSAGLPATWSVVNNGTDGADWTYTNDAALGSTSGADGYMKVDDFAADATALTNADLITNSIDMTSNTTGLIKLEFEHFYNHFTTDTATLLVSNDNGMSWTQIDKYTSDEGTVDAPTFETYDITDIAAGYANVRVRWNYNDGGSQTFEWNVDDIHIYEYQLLDEAEIITFDITGQVTSTVNSTDATVNIIMPFGSDISAISPSFTLSTGASAFVGTVPQVSGASVLSFVGSDVTPKVYTILAEDQTTTKDWDVSVSVQTDINSNTNGEFSVFPNPNNGDFNLNVYSENGFTYKIFSTDGKLIKVENVETSGMYSDQLSIKGYAPGIYTIEVTTDDMTKVQKLIIK